MHSFITGRVKKKHIQYKILATVYKSSCKNSIAFLLPAFGFKLL